jgi:peptide-methionine (R)-S-oxide reductase
MKNVVLLLICLTFWNCQGQKKPPIAYEVQKTQEEWKQLLTPQQFEILRKKGTERAYTGEYWDHFEKGSYACSGCGQVLFTSNTKFDSHCGWPSFDKAIKGTVVYENDYSFGMNRVEVLCSKCGGHLGHVFNDGPKETTGQRYCMNSVSLTFIPEGEKPNKKE